MADPTRLWAWYLDMDDTDPLTREALAGFLLARARATP
jgi:hypothetical protein